jgi:heterodisulfide reductase subunit A
MGVHFYHGRVSSIALAESNEDNEAQPGKLLVKWEEAFHNQPDHVLVDMVVLSTGFEPQMDAGSVAATFGIGRGQDGFFLERHPKLAPVETASEGIYLAGACQAPKDIPDSVAQAGAAAAAALSLMDQGSIALDPSIAEVDTRYCAGCGQCVAACPYKAIELDFVREKRYAKVNEYLCKGCGTCASACPNKAISLIHFDDRELVAEIIGALSANIQEAA